MHATRRVFPLTSNDTIFALSSGRPPAAIAVVRISGPHAGPALEKLIGRRPEPRKAALARVRHPKTREIIDEALALWFPGPNSETGEDIAELQLHGGRAVIAAVLAALATLEGLRPAEAGEFTRRAFENGRLDLTAVEGLADLIGAETEAQRRQAYRQLKGLLGDRAESWRARLIDALAMVEARIDFSDEADVPDDLVAPALVIAKGLRDEIAEALAGAGRGERLRDGLVVAIAGPPNAGKSTLLNRIARREAAIVSPIPGTTRDVIEVHLDLDGYPVTLLDTAGIGDSDDPVEQVGVRRARVRASAADLVLWVVDVSQPPAGRGGPLAEAPSAPSLLGAPDPSCAGVSADSTTVPIVWTVGNKIDKSKSFLHELTTGKYDSEFALSKMRFTISASTGLEMNTLFDQLTSHAKAYFGAESSLITRQRHRKALVTAQAALDRALNEGSTGREDIVAEELRLAARTLGRLTGRVDVEDILDVIFRDFCIGK
jgi:tRNA modification GTPase